jgi:hypothetical protein
MLGHLATECGKEYGKLVQKLLAIACCESGAVRLIDRSTQGIDLEVTFHDGLRVAFEVKTGQAGTVTFGKKDLDGLAGRASRAEGEVQRAEAGRRSVDSSLDAARQRLEEVVAKYRELAESARGIEGDRNRATAELAASRRSLDACQAANVDLAGIAEEALKRYEQKGVFAALAQKDPVTGIERARIGNLVDGYRSEIEAKRVPVSGAGAAPAPRP